MKPILFLFVLVFGYTLLPVPAFSITNPRGSAQTEISTPVLKVTKKIKKHRKTDFDMSHPVKKWLWMTLLLVLIGAVLRVLGLGGLAYIAGVAAGICLIIWFLKFAQIL